MNRIGLYFNVRKLLLSGLEKVSSSKIPFLHSIVTKILPQLDKTTIEPDEVGEALRLAGDLVGRQPLVKGLKLLKHTNVHSLIHTRSQKELAMDGEPFKSSQYLDTILTIYELFLGGWVV